MIKEKLNKIRERAIQCTELTKGFVPEQRDNKIETIDTLSGDVQELVQLIPEIIGEFKEWYDKLSPAEKCTVWPPAGSGCGTGLYNMETTDLVDKFLSTKKP